MKEKSKTVDAVTNANVDQSGARDTAAQQKKNTAESKKVAKPTAAQKKADAAAATAGGVATTGTAATAAQDKKNTAASKEVAKEKVNLGTPAAEKAMEKAAKP